MTDLPKTVRKLTTRQAGIRKLAPSPSHRHVTLTVQTAHAAFGAAAAVLEELRPSLDPKGVWPQGASSPGTAFSKALATELKAFLKAAEDLAAGRDKDVAKKLAVRIAWGSVKWLSKLSPVRREDIEDIKDLLEALSDLSGVAGATRERKKQARVAAAFMRWSQAITLLAMSVAAEGERFLDAVKARPARTIDERIAATQRRMVGLVPSWYE